MAGERVAQLPISGRQVARFLESRGFSTEQFKGGAVLTNGAGPDFRVYWRHKTTRLTFARHIGLRCGLTLDEVAVALAAV